MAGRMIYTAPFPEDTHECDLPARSEWVDHPNGTMEHVWHVASGSVWRCDRGHLWLAEGSYWIPAPWRIRWRYRKKV